MGPGEVRRERLSARSDSPVVQRGSLRNQSPLGEHLSTAGGIAILASLIVLPIVVLFATILRFWREPLRPGVISRLVTRPLGEAHCGIPWWWRLLRRVGALAETSLNLRRRPELQVDAI